MAPFQALPVEIAVADAVAEVDVAVEAAEARVAEREAATIEV